MARKLAWSLLVCFAHLTILPGCQHIPYFGSSAGEGSTKIYDHAQAKQSDGRHGLVSLEEVSSIPNAATENSGGKRHVPPQGPQPISTANARDDNRQTDVKHPQRAPREMEEKKKPTEGTIGMVTAEPGDQSSQPRTVGFQTPTPPMPQVAEKKSEYEPIVMALQRMLEGRHQEAIKYLSAYEDDRQELFLRLLPILTTLVKKRIEDLSTQEVAVLDKQLDGLRDTLRPRSELLVSRMCYCDEVRGYGWVRPLPDNHAFLTGTESRIGELVQLYVELKNIASEPTKEGDFLTKLTCSLELLDSTGKKVWSKAFEGNETTLRRSARLNDFYSRYGFYVPPIPAGTYQLTLRVADETNPQQRRVAHKSIDFRVTPVVPQAPLR